MLPSASRRKFIENSLKMGVALPLLSAHLFSCANQSTQKRTDTKEGLKILILGGTSFLGPHQIAYAIERGHSISTFTRGKTKPTVHADLFDNVEQLLGDRNDNLKALENRKWDAVIDNSGHDVEWAKKSAELLKDNCDLYLFTSSTGVFYPYNKSNYNENAELLLVEPEVINVEEEKLEYWYGVMKANSELAVMEQFGKDRTIIVRPTYMIGPADKSNRFIHWPIRLSKGGEVLVPGKAEDMVQYLDVRDAAEWMIRLIEDKKTGTFNAVGPKEPQNMYDFINKSREAFDAENKLVKIDDYEFLKKHKIKDLVPWIMPVGKNAGSAHISNEKAILNGLTYRPIQRTIKDTHDWWYSDAVSQEVRDQVESDPTSVLAREQAIIKDWMS